MIHLHSSTEQAVQLLRRGEIIAIPTETVYGLAADIHNEAAIRRVFGMKARPFFDPLIVHVASLKQAKSLVLEWTPLTDFLARYFWPGPLTLVLPKAESVSSLITSGLSTVAVRFPEHPVALEIIENFGPLAAPSANKFGHTSPTEAQHVKDEFKGEGLYVVDGGACEIGIESSVIEVGADDQYISILRPGRIGTIELKEALSKWSHPVEIKKEQSHKSPGHTKHHYVPSIAFAVLMKNESTQDLKEVLPPQTDLDRGVQLKLSLDPIIAARELYAQLRIASETKDAKFIYYFLDPVQIKDSRWEAILDRLKRASEFKTAAASVALRAADPSA